MKLFHRHRSSALASNPTEKWIEEHEAEFYNPLNDERTQTGTRSVNIVRCCRHLPWHERTATIEHEVERLGIKAGDTVRVTDQWGNEQEDVWACTEKDTGSVCFADGRLGPRGDEIVYIELVKAA